VSFINWQLNSDKKLNKSGRSKEHS